MSPVLRKYYIFAYFDACIRIQFEWMPEVDLKKKNTDNLTYSQNVNSIKHLNMFGEYIVETFFKTAKMGIQI